MDSKITTGHCRMCLKLCLGAKFKISAEKAQLYRLVTGFRIARTDSLKFICQRCEEFLKMLQEFKLAAIKAEIRMKEVKVEEVLETVEFLPVSALMTVSEIKTESDAENDNLDETEYFTEYLDGTELSAKDSLSNQQKRLFSNQDRATEEKVTAFSIDQNQSEGKIEYPDQFSQIKNELEPVSQDEESKLLDKKRGRPRKSLQDQPNHKRGRPRKPASQEELNKPKRKRGRPKKPLEEQASFLRLKRGRPTKPIKVNRREKVYICLICGRKFRDSLRLECHEALTHFIELNMPVFECALCARQIGSKKVLAIHLREHHAERSCPECGKLYTTAKGLRLHRQTIHPKVKQDVSCDRCGKNFSTMKYLKAHAKTHELSYRCPMCPSQFYSGSSSLRLHLSSRHKEVKLPPLGTPLRNFDWSKLIK